MYLWIAALLTSAQLSAASCLPEDTQEAITPITHVIVFDMGGILGEHTEKTLQKHIIHYAQQKVGLLAIARRYLSHREEFSRIEIHRLLTLTLDRIAGGRYPADKLPAYDEVSKPHSSGFCAVQAGLISCEEIGTMLPTIIDELIAEGIFASKVQAALIEAIVATSFAHPHILAESYRPIQASAKLVHELAQQPHIKMMVLSNFSVEQFAHLTEQPHMASLFSYFEPSCIFVSGMKLSNGTRLAVKPNHDAFREIISYCQQRFQVSPSQITFIDNQALNVAHAQLCGINGLLVNCTESDQPSYTFATLRTELEQRGLLPQQSPHSTPLQQQLISSIQRITAPSRSIAISAGCLLGLIIWRLTAQNPTTTPAVSTALHEVVQQHTPSL